MKRLIIICITATLLAACAIDPYTREEKVSNTGIGIGAGAATGAIIGALAGGGKGAAIGAASGAVLGGGIGYYMDRQEAKLRERLDGTGIGIQRDGDNINLIMPGNITFASNSANINANFYKVLDDVGIVLQEFDKTGINVSGYTDSTGSFELNQRLSEQRASSVATYLARTGINSNRIQARGYGKRNPIASNTTTSGRSRNRRVEISIRPKG